MLRNKCSLMSYAGNRGMYCEFPMSTRIRGGERERDGGCSRLRRGIDCFVENWKDLIGDTDRYLAKQNPRKISGSLISPVRCAFIKKKEEKKKRTEEKRKEKTPVEIERWCHVTIASRSRKCIASNRRINYKRTECYGRADLANLSVVSVIHHAIQRFAID